MEEECPQQHLCFCLACGRSCLTAISESYDGVEDKRFDGRHVGDLLGVSVVKRCGRCVDGIPYSLTVEEAERRIRIAYYLADFLTAAGSLFQEDRDLSEWYDMLDTEFSPKRTVDNMVMDSDKIVQSIKNDMQKVHEDVRLCERRVPWHWAQCVKKMLCVERLLGNGSKESLSEEVGVAGLQN
jgi:hypothetical protein